MSSARPDSDVRTTDAREPLAPAEKRDTGAGNVARDTAAPDTSPVAPPEVGPNVLDASVNPDGATLALDVGDAAPAGPKNAARLFDTSFLHEIELTSPMTIDAVHAVRDRYTKATITIDGVTLVDIGVRGKGNEGSVPKPSQGEFHKFPLSLKTDAFVVDQKIYGIDKFTLNSARQDKAWLNEHIGYEVARRAGLPGPLTAHAVVTFNKEVMGIYVMREAFDGDFFRRVLGEKGSGGNLYEAPCPNDCTDFAVHPELMELKDEVEDKRTRDDMNALAAAVRKTAVDDAWVTAVSEKLDLDNFLTSYVVDGLVVHWDGFAYDINNYFMYANPMDGGRFIFLPHGMDSIMGVDSTPGFKPPGVDPFRTDPPAVLAKAIWKNAKLTQRYKDTMRQVLTDAWNVDALLARIETLNRVMHATKRKDTRIVDELKRFDGAIEQVRQFVRTRKSFVVK